MRKPWLGQCGAVDCQRLQRNERMKVYLRKKRAEYRLRGESYDFRNLSPEQRVERVAALKQLLADLEDLEPGRASRSRARIHEKRRQQKQHEGAELFTSQEIFERDGWVCGICGVPVDSSLKHPDPRSASIDHVIPLWAGGPHTRDNVQLAHLECNVEKRCRLLDVECEESSLRWMPSDTSPPG